MPVKKFFPFDGRINRRDPRDQASIVERVNLLSRNKTAKLISGTEKATTDAATDIFTWAARYYSVETGIRSPKTLGYTKDGKIWHIDLVSETMTEIQDNLAPNAYPEHWNFKAGNQTIMYLCDGKNLWKHDGNNDHKFEKVTITDTAGATIDPIDNIEHLDRQLLISANYLYVSKNLDFDIFNDPNDSIQIVVGSGKGKNLAVQKIDGIDGVFILTTEGIFVLYGDVISALAATFEVRKVEQRNIIAGRTARQVENAILFLSDDYNLWSFNGQTTQKMSHPEKLEDFVNPERVFLDKAVAHYDPIDNYYKLSFVETGETSPNIEIWYDAITQKIDFVRGRNVSCYVQADATQEKNFTMACRSDANYIVYTNRGRDFDGSNIELKLRTGDIRIGDGDNARIIGLYPKVTPEGDKEIFMRYLLDGRLSQSDDSVGNAMVDLNGENIGLGFINISNQAQITSRIRPQIKYSKGTSIAFEFYAQASDIDIELHSIGVEVVGKGTKKSKKVGA